MPPPFGSVIAALAPDVAIFTEYVPGPHHSDYLDALADAGLKYWLLPPFAAKENHVLVASRYMLSEGAIRAPAIAPAVPSNALHVRVSDWGFDLLGIRVPDYSRQPQLRRTCWDWIEGVAHSVINQPFVLMGDFNTDPRYSRAKCGDRIAGLVASGWQHAAPSNGCSYWTPKRHEVVIDHAFFTPHFQVHKAEYVREVDGIAMAGKVGALSDHAALLVEVEYNSNAQGS